MTPEARKWLFTGRARALPDHLSIEFDRYLNTLAWLGSGLDWSKMPSEKRINVVDATPSDFAAWLAGTAIGQHSHTVVWYSAEEGGIVVPAIAGVDDLDELYWHAPGVRFACGAELQEGIVVPRYSDLMQYGSGDEIIATAAR